MPRFAATIMPILVVVLAALACGGGQASHDGSTPTASQLPLAFVRDGDIWMVNSGGSDERRLTGWGDVQDFEWAPGGEMMIVLRQRLGGPFPREDLPHLEPPCDPSLCDPFPASWPFYKATVINVQGETVLDIPDAQFANWSPRGDLLAYPGWLGWKVIDLQGREVLELLDASTPVWSPDQTKIAYGRVVDRNCSEPCTTPVVLNLTDHSVWEVDPLSQSAGAVRFSPDGRWLSYGSTLVNVATHEKRSLPGLAVSWSPNSRYLALFQGAHLGGIAIYEVANSEMVCERVTFMPPIYAHESSAVAGKWSSDGRWFVFAQDYYEKGVGIRNALAVAEADTCQTHGIKPIGIAASAGVELDISPDHRHIVYTGSVSTWVTGRVAGLDGSPGPMWVVGMDGTTPTELGTGMHPRWQPAAMP